MKPDFKFAFECKKFSEHWGKYFEAVDPKAETAHLVCKFCKHVAKHPNCNKHVSPGKLGVHLETCDKYQASQYVSIKERLLAQGNRPYMETKMTTDKLTERVLRGAIYANLSFRAATNPVWMGVLQKAYPDLSMPDRRSLTKCLKKKALEGRNELKTNLLLNDSKISLALDGWTSANNISFQGMYRAKCIFCPVCYVARYIC